MKKFVAWLLISTFSVSAFPQTATPAAQPQVTQARALAIPVAEKTAGQCTFEPQISNDDKTLLENTKNAITALRQNSKCNMMASQFDAFQEALKAYNQQTGMDRVPGYDGNLNVTCANYSSIYDSNFGSFSDNWEDPGAGIGSDVYFNCRSKNTREEALECAAIITGRQKNLKRAQCDAQKDAISAQAMGQLLNHGYTTGLEAVQAILNNKECIDAAGEQKLSFIQSAVSLASRAASLSYLGTGVGLLVGAASQVVGSAIKNFFMNSAQNRDHLAILVNRENFTKVACLYEQIESKALRCERIAANINEEAMLGLRSRSEAVCAENLELVGSSSGLKQIDELLQSIKKEAEAKNLEQNDFDSLVGALSQTFPGSEASVLERALGAANDVSQDLSKALENDNELRNYLSQNEPDKAFSSADLRSGKREVEKKKKRTDAVINVLNSIRESDQKGTDMSEEDLKKVEEAMKAFDGDTLNFQGTYNEILISRATRDDDIGKQLSAFNARMKDAGTFLEVKNMIDNQKRISSSPFDDGGRFIESRSAIQPHLANMMKKEVATLAERAGRLKDIPQGIPSTALKETLLTQEESVIYPLLRACSQLRSVSTESKRRNISNVSSENEPSICRVFDCDDGAKTFEDYLKQKQLSNLEPSRCTTECLAHYNRYICDQKQSLARSRAKVKREFTEKGTICGKPLGQIFK